MCKGKNRLSDKIQRKIYLFRNTAGKSVHQKAEMKLKGEGSIKKEQVKPAPVKEKPRRVV